VSMLLMVRAMNTKVGNPLRKLVLIKLADNANDSGECWPSYQHIADQCEISTRSVIRHIDALCEAGLLQKQHRPGPKGNSSNLYQITLRGDRESLGVVTESHKGGDTVSPGGSDRESPRTSHSFEPVNEPVNAQQAGRHGITFKAIQEAYNSICPPTLPACAVMSEKRKRQIKAMCEIDFMGTKPFRKGIEVWRQYFTDCLTDRHWCGDNARGWTADFDFVTKPANAIKLMERMN